MVEDWRQGGFGLYVHWPFCAAKCPYCDFNSHVTASVDQERWARAFLAEIARVAAETPGRVVNSIFFGGGTPSLMEVSTVAAVIDAAAAHWSFANDIEITLEANPGSVEATRFAGYREAGVNRVSMGLQALNDADLRRLGRIHSVAEALAAFDIARALFDRVSFDLIYARQGQTLSDWESELSRALSLAVDHLSLYQLTIEPGTAFHARQQAGGLKGLPDEGLGAEMYDLTQDLCNSAGMPAYEVSNHARPGAESCHNLIYWRTGDYAGIGPGAHGRLTLDGQRYATEAPRSPGAWLDAAERGFGEHPRELLTAQDCASEYLIMCLRLSEGLDMDRYAALAGEPLDSVTLDHLKAHDLITVERHRLCATPKGRVLLNALIEALLPG